MKGIAAAVLILILVASSRASWAEEVASSAPSDSSDAFLDMHGPLTANPHPAVIEAGPFGSPTLSGVLTGLAFAQTNAVQSDRSERVDLSNGQAFIQNTSGVFQYFVQAGVYSLPTIGSPYVAAGRTTSELFGPVPQAFVKIVLADGWSIMGGKLSSLVGYEDTFSYQNQNIERGLLWNQTNSVNRGLQIDRQSGPLKLSLSVNDGFYADRLTWLSGQATLNIGNMQSVSFSGASNTRTVLLSTPATPLLQNNSQIYSLVYRCNLGPWTIWPTIQYTRVPSLPLMGYATSGATYGAALFVTYALGSNARVGSLDLNGFSLPFRTEFIASRGGNSTTDNLLYGRQSAAFSATITPTYQRGAYFLRTELSYVKAINAAPTLAFGVSGNSQSQLRLLLETGVLF